MATDIIIGLVAAEKQDIGTVNALCDRTVQLMSFTTNQKTKPLLMGCLRNKQRIDLKCPVGANLESDAQVIWVTY
jgi:hypothetical protein